MDGDQGELEEFLVKVDRDGSGSIEWTEFLDFMANQLRRATTEDRSYCLQWTGALLSSNLSSGSQGCWRGLKLWTGMVMV